MSNLSRFVGNTKLFVMGHKADIAFVSGMGLTAVGSFFLVKQSFKFKERIDEHKKQTDELKEQEEKEDVKDEEGNVIMSVDKKEIAKKKHDICKTTVKEAVKDYALPVSLLVAGESLKVYAHTSLKNDLGAVSVALNAAIAAYEGIKEKVIATDGVEKWNEYAYKDSFEAFVDVDKETGEVVAEHDVQISPFRDLFAEFFDEGNPNYKKYPGANKTFIMMVEQWASDKIERDGYILYHDVLKEMGFKDPVYLREETCKAGWVFNPNRAHQCDFGLHYGDEATKRFMDEDEMSVLLRFDCVPNIYSYIR